MASLAADNRRAVHRYFGPVHNQNGTIAGLRRRSPRQSDVGFFIAHYDAAKRFDATDEILDQTPPFVFLAGVIVATFRSLAGRNDCLDAMLRELVFDSARARPRLDDVSSTNSNESSGLTVASSAEGLSRRNSSTLMATRITHSFKQRRIDSFCSLCQMRR